MLLAKAPPVLSGKNALAHAQHTLHTKGIQQMYDNLDMGATIQSANYLCLVLQVLFTQKGDLKEAKQITYSYILVPTPQI
jgi:hypothetical protein